MYFLLYVVRSFVSKFYVVMIVSKCLVFILFLYDFCFYRAGAYFILIHLFCLYAEQTRNQLPNTVCVPSAVMTALSR